LAIAALSPRQAEIVELVAMGLSDKEIGRRLHLAEETVGWHLKKIFLKWGVHSRTALASRRLRQTPPKRTLSGLPSPTNVGVVAVSGK
jgi:two-component system nitrate/nitrite response regulator NarL